MTTVSTLPDDKVMFSNLTDRFVSAPENIYQHGLEWYLQAHDEAVRLAHDYGLTVAQTSGIIARLSPGIRWNRNIIAAEQLLEGEGKVDGYSRNAKVARKIAMGQFGTSYSDVLTSFPPLTAQKISNFYQNIYNPVDTRPVTIDRWMIRAVFDRMQYETLPNDLKVKPDDYARIADSIKRIAKRHGLIPNQVQAIIWEMIRSNNQ